MILYTIICILIIFGAISDEGKNNIKLSTKEIIILLILAPLIVPLILGTVLNKNL